MPKDQLEAFLKAVKGDSNLQDKLNAAIDAEAVVAIAKESGFQIDADEIKAARIALSDEELSGVAGGASPQTSEAAGSMCTTGEPRDACQCN